MKHKLLKQLSRQAILSNLFAHVFSDQCHFRVKLERHHAKAFLGILLLGVFVSSPTLAATLTSITVTPSSPTVAVGQQKQFIATGNYDDGSTQVLGYRASMIVAGRGHTCALLTSGSVQCWGNNQNGELGNKSTINQSTPVPVSGIDGATASATAIAAGLYYTCALLTSGAVKCWGINASGQLGDNSTNEAHSPVNVYGIDGATESATAITAGSYHACALLTGGAVQCWGNNNQGELGNNSTKSVSTPVPVSGIDGTTASAIALAAGGYHTCALLTTGAVQCWGEGTSGQLGYGATVSSKLPVTVSGIDGTMASATAIAAGSFYTCALLTTGAVQCWGENDNGSLGNGTTTSSKIPVTVSGIDGTTASATAITAGTLHACALLTSGTVQCWGYNVYGQLGDNSLAEADSPVTVNGIDDTTASVVDVAAGWYHTCALLSTGTVLCWGTNDYGELGNNSTTGSYTPVIVSGIGDTAASAVAAGDDFACALLSTGMVQCWGENSSGQLGNGTTMYSESPVTVSGIDGVTTSATAITAGGAHACALLPTGAVLCWGDNVQGDLGNNSTSSSQIPVPVYGLDGSTAAPSATTITAGETHTCAVLTGGAVQCWGSNTHGQLGNGTTTFSTIPVTVKGIDGARVSATAITAGWLHTCAVLTGGAVRCWGDNLYGQLGNNSTSASYTPVAAYGIDGVKGSATAITAGANHTCALLNIGAVKCWGQNLNGQLGNNSTSSSDIPVAVDGIDGATASATAITAGWWHTCAVLASEAVQCWGDNSFGKLGNGTTTIAYTPATVSGINGATASAKAVAAGANHTCALLSTGMVQCWGENSRGQLGNNSLTDSYTRVSVQYLGLGPIWTSSDLSVASVTASGLTSAQSTGSATITASLGAISGSALLSVIPVTHTLTIMMAGTGTGTVSGAGTYNQGSTVTVSASADAGSTFSGWTGPNATECQSGSVVASADKSCTANFILSTNPGGAPAAPTGLIATSGDGQVNLSWTVSSGATTYNVYEGATAGGESSTPVATGITGSSTSITGLVNGTTYYFKVAAVNANGNSAQSNEVSGIPEAGGGAPGAPTGLGATSGDGQVTLSWTASNGATSYNVYEGTTAGGESSTPVTTGITGTSTSIAGLDNGTTYYFTIVAVNNNGVSSASAETSATPNTNVTPASAGGGGGGGGIGPETLFGLVSLIIGFSYTHRRVRVKPEVGKLH